MPLFVHKAVTNKFIYKRNNVQIDNKEKKVTEENEHKKSNLCNLF